MNLKDLIDDVLPDLDGGAAKKLLSGLEAEAKSVAVGEIAKLAARGLVKGIDGFAKAAVRHLGPNDTVVLMDAYANALEAQFQQLAEAAVEYAPLALDVEIRKERYGSSSAEANEARQRREVAMGELRAEVKDLLLTAVGSEAGD